jgi:chromosome segregation ATPase
MFLGILTLFVAISISIIAAYYSIIGLTAIFAAAFLPIVLMGSVLEVGKLLATVWLHQNWHRAPMVIKSYLVTAVVVLMFITSMGVFGFLSKSHIEQSAMGTEQIAQVEVLDKKMARIQAKVNRWTEDIKRLNQGETSTRLDVLIKRERDRIKEANNRIQPQIDAENAKIPGLQAQADKEIAQQNKRLSDAQNRTKADIAQAEKRLAVLDKDVEAYLKQGTTKGGVFTADVDNVAKGNQLRKEQKPERDKLNSDIAKAKQNEIGVASRVQSQITAINKKLAEQINQVEVRIQKIRDSIKGTIDSANANIAKYTTEAGTTNDSVDEKIAQLEKNIESVQPELDKLREEKFVFEKEYRQFEAEVGPVKYIAELIYGEADRNLLEDAVRWVIIIIVAVFDPLAVCLVLAGTMTIGWWREDRQKNKPKVKEQIVRVTDPRVEELEMELKKHNEVLAEIEKLLDGNLANVDPAKYAELQKERDELVEKIAGLEAQLAEAKAESDALVDKVVATEAERDNYKKTLDEIAAGAEGLKTREEELLKKIADQEAEIERRDAVVIKMAEKYQLVEKDEFAQGLEAEVNTETPEEPKKG